MLDCPSVVSPNPPMLPSLMRGGRSIREHFTGLQVGGIADGPGKDSRSLLAGESNTHEGCCIEDLRVDSAAIGHS